MTKFVCHECQRSFDRAKWNVGLKYCSLACHYWSGVDFEKKGCWIWKKRINRKGIGTVRWKGKEYSAHILGYAAMTGKTEWKGRLVNLCGNSACVRGDHWKESERSKKC